MICKKRNGKITIVIDQKADAFMFERCTAQNNLEDYVKHLINLDYEVNGTNEEFMVYQSNEIYEQTINSHSVDELNEEKNEIIKDIINYIEHLYDATPSAFKNCFYGPEEGVINIASDNIAGYLKMLSERLQVITRVIKTNQNKEGEIK